MKPGTPFDSCNPPARLFWADGRPSMAGYLLDAERQWSRTCMENHRRDPAKYSKPGYIVRLKSWKLPTQPK